VIGGEGHPQGLERRNLVKPTVFAQVKPEVRIAREEIFGPVLSILTYRTEGEAIQLANDSEFGLMVYVSSSSLKAENPKSNLLQPQFFTHDLGSLGALVLRSDACCRIRSMNARNRAGIFRRLG
jgi:hypothetical protein